MKQKKIFLFVFSIAFLCFLKNECLCQNTGWPHWGHVPRINPNTLSRARDALGKLGVNIDPDNKQQLLDSLNSPDPWVRYNVINYCGYAQIKESLPIFKTLYVKYPTSDSSHKWLSDREAILDAVTLIEDTSFQQEFRMAIDSLRYRSEKFNKLNFYSGYLMDKHRDDYGFSSIIPFFINPDSIKKYRPNMSYMYLFKETHKDQVINALIACLSSQPESYQRSGALEHLYEIGYAQITSLASNLIESDSSFNVRLTALKILKKTDHSLFEKSLVDAVYNETNLDDLKILYTQMSTIGKLWSYKMLVDIYNNDPRNNFILKVDLENPYFQKIGSDISPILQIDTLKSNVMQMFFFGWLGDNSFNNELCSFLDQARSFLFTGDSVKCARQVKIFQSRINEEYCDSLDNDNRFVTVYGWRFLYNKARWLLDRLPQIPEDILYVPGQYATVQLAIDAATSGKTVIVSAGTYNENVTISNKNAISLVTTSNATVRGVHITNSSLINLQGFIINASTTTTDGIVIDGTSNSDITVEANTVQNSTKNGITLGENTGSIALFNNVIANNAKNGIECTAGSNGVKYIVNNTIVKNGKSGIDAISPQRLCVVNNIIIYDAGTGRSGLHCVAQTTMSSILLKNNMSVTQSGGILQSDYRLTPTSRAKDQGTTQFAPLPLKDKDGNTRVAGTTIDLGAYELQ
jgi:hypothetical protein